MELNLFSCIIFSLNAFITSNFVYPSALIYGVEVIEDDPILKFPKPEGFVTSERKDADKLPGVPISFPTRRSEVDPCIPSPCGPNFRCQLINGHASCTCVPNYIGVPPRCTPQCTIDSECNAAMACINNRCSDPCPGVCGDYAQCSVKNHKTYCTCFPGFTGDPFTSCQIMHQVPLSIPMQRAEVNPCIPSPCGPNSQCQEFNGNARCICLPDYTGFPPRCRPECIIDSECNEVMACFNNQCRDPCLGICGNNTQCNVINHTPYCSCLPGFSGDPFVSCKIMHQDVKPTPCSPSPCGPNSDCRQVNSKAKCSCLTNFMGAPPNCRSECTINSDCTSDKACLHYKCVDPCVNRCTRNANCRTIAHNPTCSCQDGFTGDPFTRCIPISIPTPRPEVDPCIPSPCGPNSQCQENNDYTRGTYHLSKIGFLPSCSPECTINPECNAVSACINNRCRDPCLGACGDNAQCSVSNHIPYCSCLPGFTGNPFKTCKILIEAFAGSACASGSVRVNGNCVPID